MSSLYAKDFQITDKISIIVPSVGDIIDHEDDYYSAVCIIVATPYDMMVQLDDAKIDFTKINDFELFCLLFQHLKEMDTRMIFGELDLSKFRTAENKQTGEVVLLDEENDIIIDRVAHTKICESIRNMLHIERTNKKAGNAEAKEYLLKRARLKQKRSKNKKHSSVLEKYIIALVNTEQFKYNYETVRHISILQFYASLNQIAHKIRYDNTMRGIYAGTVKFEDLPLPDRNWIQTE